jgi:tetratricopeptide (TPR) repeat protein
MTRHSKLLCAFLLLLGLAIAGVCLTQSASELTSEELFLDGVDAVERGELAVARSIRKKLTERGADNEARILNGGLLAAGSQWSASLDLLDPSLAQGHLRRPVLLWAGRCLLQIRELGRAEVVLSALVSEFPDDSKAVRMLAVTYYDLGAMHPALDALEQLKRLEPDDYRPHHMSGVIQLDFELFKQAAVDFTKALARKPPEATRIEISQDLARAQVKLLRFREALRLLKELPDTPENLAIESVCYLALGNELKAEQKIRLGQKLLGTSEEFVGELLNAEARLLTQRGDHEAALAVLQNLSALEPHNVQTLHAIGLAFGRLGRDAERDAAIVRTEHVRGLRKELTDLSKRANAEPYNVEVRTRLASVCTELELHELAKSWYQAARAIQDSTAWRKQVDSQ